MIFALFCISRANALPPEIPLELMEQANWSSSLRSAYREYRDVVSDYARRDWPTMGPKSASKLQGVIDEAVSDFGDISPSVGLLEIEMLFFLMNSGPVDLDSLVDHAWRAAKALRTEDGKLRNALNISFPTIAFTLIRHGRQFEGETFLREIVQNGNPYFLGNDIQLLISMMPQKDEIERTLNDAKAADKYKNDLHILKSAAEILNAEILLKRVNERLAQFKQQEN